MNYLYFLFFDDTLSNKDQIRRAIERYFNFINGLNNIITVTVLDNSVDEYSIINDIENINDDSKVYFYFMNYNKKNIELFEKVKLTKDDFNRTNIYLLKEKIKGKMFCKIVQSFKHDAEHDLVNSELGVLKVWCDNQAYLSDDFIDSKFIDACKDSLNKINEYFCLTGNQWNYSSSLLAEKELIIYYANQIKTSLSDNNFKVSQSLQTKISNYLKYIFDFISKYK